MTLKLHHLRPAPGAKTAKTRVGRGEGSKGKTAGRGTKGTKARYQVPASFEGGQMPLHMRLPKLKGFKNPFRVEFQVVNLDRLSELFPDGGDGHVRGPGREGRGPRRRSRSRCSAAARSPWRAGERARVLRLGQGEDRRCRRQHHRALTGSSVTRSDRHARDVARDRGSTRPAVGPSAAAGRPGPC